MSWLNTALVRKEHPTLVDGYIPNYYINHVDINFQRNEKEKHVDLNF
jgi:hypothetical protein